jgi:uncharacterized membrane protein HdeD (DUF308 family)
MKETTMKLLTGWLMVLAAILFMAGATFFARPMTAPNYVLAAAAIMFLCLGTMKLVRARRPK